MKVTTGGDDHGALYKNQAADFTNATVRAMREIDPQFIPDGFLAGPTVETIRAHVRPVPRRDALGEADVQPENTDTTTARPVDHVNPEHYRLGRYEVQDVIEEWEINKDGERMQAFQYIVRAPHKGSFKDDLAKAIWYLARRIGCDVTLTDREKQE